MGGNTVCRIPRRTADSERGSGFDEVPDAAKINQFPDNEIPPRHRVGQDDFRVFSHQSSMGMMAGMNIAQQAGGLLNHEPGNKKHGLIERPVTKGGAVRCFVYHAGGEYPDTAIKQERRDTP